jgi:hypothetical protein
MYVMIRTEVARWVPRPGPRPADVAREPDVGT